MTTRNSMQITTEVTLCHTAPLSYCDRPWSNTVGDVLDQGVVIMGCRLTGNIQRGAWSGLEALDSFGPSRAYRLTKSFSTAALCTQI